MGSRSLRGRISPGRRFTVDVLDQRLRPVKQRLIGPMAASAIPLQPATVTVVALSVGIAAAVAAAAGWWWLAFVLFGANRVLDGLDGEIARARSSVSDAGGYADLMADSAVYAALPIGAAIGSDIPHIWPVVAALLASFYLNTVSWTYLSALIEKRGERSTDATSIEMPSGLVEGTETMLFYAVMLFVPVWLDWTMGVMAAAVTLGALLRFAQAQRRLDTVANRVEATADV